MALRDLTQVSYLPMLSARPAEMVALQELPNRDKDLLLPFFQLRPWVAARRLSAAIDRLEEAYGNRPFFISLAEPDFSGERREVHDELDQLRDAARGFANWCEFVEERPNLMPALQLTDVAQFDAQATRLHALGRGVIVHIERGAFPFIRQIANRTAANTNRGTDTVFVLDFGRQTNTFLVHVAETVGYMRTILEAAPLARVALSASSFPSSFTALTEQPIFERRVFEEVRAQIGPAALYSDRGSARAERQAGGGRPIPRVDYVKPSSWLFFRDDEGLDRPAAYAQQARTLMSSPDWRPDLRIWGTQMIERTAAGDPSAIVSPARSTAARINIHLHLQTFYDDPDSAFDTDEDWTD